MSFSSLKQNRSKMFDKLVDAAEQASKGQGGARPGADERYWKPTVDKAGNGSAVIRFLPPSEGEDVPFVRYWDHGFQGPGGWYIEKSLTTLGKDDPCSEYNNKLWNSGIESDKAIARKQKRRLHYVSNIMVISDPANPANEGKVFLYEYGKKIFDLLNDTMHPQFEDEDAINPFDLWEGANFRLRIRNVEGYRNYDKSTFDSPTALASSDDELEQIWKSQHSLQAVIAPSEFKTYEQLSAKLTKVLGNVASTSTAEDFADDDSDNIWNPPAKPQAEAKAAPVKEAAPAASDDGDDDELDFFRQLAEG